MSSYEKTYFQHMIMKWIEKQIQDFEGYSMAPAYLNELLKGVFPICEFPYHHPTAEGVVTAWGAGEEHKGRYSRDGDGYKCSVYCNKGCKGYV